MKLPLRVLAHDPGSANYGVSLIEAMVSRGRVKFSVVTNYRYRSTIRDIKKVKVLREHVSAYTKEFNEQVKRLKPHIVVAERFQARGRTGATSEYVNIMLGVMAHTLMGVKLPMLLTTASTWKNEIRRWGIDLDALYKQVRVTPHQLDATLMGVWMAYRALVIVGKIKAKRPKISKAWVKEIIKQVETTSADPLKKEKKNARSRNV